MLSMRILFVQHGTPVLYIVSMGRYFMKRFGFNAVLLTSAWFWGYQAIRQVAMFGQL